MCERCQEIDFRIERCERIIVGINDALTIDRLKQMIADLKEEKALHPEQNLITSSAEDYRALPWLIAEAW